MIAFFVRTGLSCIYLYDVFRDNGDLLYRDKNALNNMKINLLEKRIIDEEFLSTLDEEELCSVCCDSYKINDEITFL